LVIGPGEAADLCVQVGDAPAPVGELNRFDRVSDGGFCHGATLRCVDRHRNGASIGGFAGNPAGT
jgi:hypothetical protein